MDYQTKIKIKRIFNQPFITYGLLVVTTVFFLGMELTGGSEVNEVLLRWGAMQKQSIVQNHEFWRFFTPMFLHIGWMHFAVNMVTLYYVGRQVENIYGHWRYLAIYLLSGIAGNLLSFAFSQGAVSAGASTSLFGLFGAFLILGRHFRNDPAIAFMSRQYGIFIAINLFFNLFSPSVDIAGHIGGLLGGLLTATFLAVPKRSESFNIHERIISGMIFVFILVICFFLGFKNAY
ncbi:rhomboid family intramembrane serine protease [Enterococcus sp. LJL128]